MQRSTTTYTLLYTYKLYLHKKVLFCSIATFCEKVQNTVEAQNLTPYNLAKFLSHAAHYARQSTNLLSGMIASVHPRLMKQREMLGFWRMSVSSEAISW